MSISFKPTAALLLTTAVLAAPAAAQQYYYQPNADYYRNDTAEGTVVGGGLGAITGALIGGRGNSTEGALIGAGVGAITGRLLGKSKDAADQRAVAYGSAAAAQANARATAQAVTNFDLIRMSQAGLNEGLIIGAIQSRGGRFDLSPAGLIQLKQNGVPDSVVLAAQNASPRGPQPINPTPAPTIIETPPPVVVYRPRPVYVRPPATFHIDIGGSRRGRGYHRRGHWHHW